jgi:pimeloyl-ACP methyl ester carboxylesterase
LTRFGSEPICGSEILTVDGLRIHLAEVGSGSPVVLVHGAQAWAYTWRHQLGPLAAAGYRGIAPDLPGSGYSDLPVDYDYSIEGLSGFLGRLLDALSLDRAAFVASSAGGLPVLELAIRHPERVTALVLVSTCGVPHRLPFLWRVLRWPLVGEAVGLLLTLSVVRSNLRQMVHDGSRISPGVVAAYHAVLRRPGAWRANLKLERSSQPAWVEENLVWIAAPTLVVWGADDPYHPPQMAHEFGQRIHGARVAILPACGHLPHEERPDDLNRLVVEFLACQRERKP